MNEQEPTRYKGIRIKFFMRKEEVEVLGPDNYLWASGHMKRRSIMSELIPEELHKELTDGDGHWYLPGTPP